MKPPEFVVLIVLADCHNPVNGCSPSQDYIVAKTNLSERTVREQLGKLKARGLVNWIETRKAGKRGSNRYTLAFEDDFQPAESAGSPTGNPAREQPAESDRSNRQNLPHNLVREPVREPVKEERKSARAREANCRPLTQRSPIRFLVRPPATAPDFDRLVALWPVKEGLARARGLWDKLEPTDRAAALAYAPDWLAAHKKRIHIEALPTWLEGGAWRMNGLPPNRIELKPFGRPWWALVWRRHARRERIGFMLAEGKAGRGWTVPAAEVPSEAEALALCEIGVDGPEFRTWQAEMAAHGVTLPRRDGVPVIFVPSQIPEGRTRTPAATGPP
jgi:hypothetical protein